MLSESFWNKDILQERTFSISVEFVLHVLYTTGGYVSQVRRTSTVYRILLEYSTVILTVAVLYGKILGQYIVHLKPVLSRSTMHIHTGSLLLLVARTYYLHLAINGRRCSLEN